MRRSSILILILLFFGPLSAQDFTDPLEAFKFAESEFFYEEYKEAEPYYTFLLLQYPDNYNLRYKIGVCYLNMPGYKQEAIQYLEEATQNMSPKARDRSFKETRAPVEALFRLADAYRINNELDKALETYERFKNTVDSKKYKIELVDEQIKACNNAKKLMQTPLYLDMENQGEMINSRFSDFTPVVSADENVIVFTRALQLQEQVFFSKRVDGRWEPPTNIQFQLGVEDIYPTSISADGKEMYLYYLDEFDGNIYVSFFNDTVWSPIVKLNENINTKYWESHASISFDGKKLFFTSNRKGVIGDLDIFVSERDSILDWGPASNLGPNINTIYNEETPFISEDGKTLYFSSYGHFNMGGYDVFYSNLLENGEWSIPLNMSYPVNTPDDNLFYMPVNNGLNAYYSMQGNDSYGNTDIYRLGLYSDEHPRKFLIQGILGIDYVRLPLDESSIVYVVDKSTGDTVQTVNPDLFTGEYQLELIHGNYDIIFEGLGYEKQVNTIFLRKDQSESVLAVQSSIIPTDIVAEMTLLDTLIQTRSSDTSEIVLQLEANSRLVVETLVDSKVVGSEVFLIKDTVFTYRFVPIAGESIKRFTLTDRIGNEIALESEVRYTPPRVVKVQARPDIPPDVIRARNELRMLSSGPLRKAIMETDLSKEGIYSYEQLQESLESKTSTYGYTAEELDRVYNLRQMLSSSDLASSRDQIEVQGSQDVKSLLKDLDPGSIGLNTSFELFEYLSERSAGKDYTHDNLIQYILNPNPLAIVQIQSIVDRFTSVAGDQMKGILDTLSLEEAGIKSKMDLVDYLSTKADSGVITREEIYRSVSFLAADGDPNVKRFFKQLIESGDNELSRFLQNIDIEKENIKVLSDLLSYLLENHEAAGISEVEIWTTYLDFILEGVPEATILEDIPIAQTEEDPEEMEKKPSAARIIIPVAAGSLLIIFLFFVYRRRKKN